MRKRRRTKYTWFPQFGTSTGDNDDDASSVVFVSIPVVPGDGTLSDVNIFPYIPDANPEIPGALSDHLDDFIGSEYFLKRIVGKFSLTAPAQTVANANNILLDFVVALGFFIARQDGSPGATNAVGTATAADRRKNYGPLNVENVREPWIWRRTWCMSQVIFDGTTGARRFDAGATFYPINNAHGSVAEGQHIDAKTARRVKQDDRLWVAVQTQAVTTIGGPGDTGIPDGVLDIRLLGALRKARGKSAF